MSLFSFRFIDASLNKQACQKLRSQIKSKVFQTENVRWELQEECLKHENYSCAVSFAFEPNQVLLWNQSEFPFEREQKLMKRYCCCPTTSCWQMQKVLFMLQISCNSCDESKFSKLTVSLQEMNQEKIDAIHSIKV